MNFPASGTSVGMSDSRVSDADRAAAVALLRRLRQNDEATGVRHSGIALDVGLHIFEAGFDVPSRPLSVDMIRAGTGYSGPTVRLVLKRLIDAGTVAPARKVGKTQLYAMTALGVLRFQRYVEVALAFRGGEDLSPAAAPAPGRGRRSGPARPRGRYADGPPDREAGG
jgi:DNA-binding transcriptional ArsR family regulator